MATTTPHQPAPARNGQVAGFAYSLSGKVSQADAWKGFGWPLPPPHLVKKLDRNLERLHPYATVKHHKFAPSEVEIRDQIAQRLFAALPELGRTPSHWQKRALVSLMTSSQGRLRRCPENNGPRPGTQPSGPTHSLNTGTTSKRRRPDTIVISDSDTDATAPLRHAKRSRSRTVPIMTYNQPRVKMVFSFRGVEHDTLTSKQGEFSSIDLLQDGRDLVDWDKLAAQAQKVGDCGTEGFCFRGKLFLSPREGQDHPIRSQEGLNQALRDCHNRTVIVTTQAISPRRVPSTPFLVAGPHVSSGPSHAHEDYMPAGDRGADRTSNAFSVASTPPMLHSKREDAHTTGEIRPRVPRANSHSMLVKKEEGESAEHARIGSIHCRLHHVSPMREDLEDADDATEEPAAFRPREVSPIEYKLEDTNPGTEEPAAFQPREVSPIEYKLEDTNTGTEEPAAFQPREVSPIEYKLEGTNPGTEEPAAFQPREVSPIDQVDNLEDADEDSEDSEDSEDTDDDGEESSSEDDPKDADEDSEDSSMEDDPEESSMEDDPDESSMEDDPKDADDASKESPADDPEDMEPPPSTWSAINSPTVQETPMDSVDEECIGDDSRFGDHSGGEDNDDNDISVKDRAEAEATAFTRTAIAQQHEASAFAEAQKADLDTWTRVANVFQVAVDHLRLQGKEKRVALPSTVGLSPHFKAMPLQLVGALELFLIALGPRGAALLIDKMGLGKSITCLLVYHINRMATTQGHDAGDGSPFPSLHDGQLHGTAPSPGPAFFVATAAGLDTIAEGWSLMHQGGATGPHAPKLVILHADAEKIARRWGGKEAGIYTSMTADDWMEIRPRPDWSRARPSYEAKPVPAGPSAHVWEKDYTKVHEDATVHAAAPSSSRFLIVTTLLSWRKRVSCNITPIDIAKQADIVTLERKIKAATNKKTRDEARKKYNKAIANWLSVHGPRADGDAPMQAKRMKRITMANGAVHRIEYVVDLAGASLIFVDELQKYPGNTTLTYIQVIGPFLDNAPTLHRTGVIGISGSALANGVGLVAHFYNEVIRRQIRTDSTDEGALQLAQVRDLNAYKAWDALVDMCKKRPRGPGSENPAHCDPEVAKLMRAMSLFIRYCCVARHYKSVDPWGRQLCIVDSELHVAYVAITHEARWLAEINKAEGEVRAAVTARYKEAMTQWEEDGDPQAPRPTKMEPADASPSAYLIARHVSCFPNLLLTIDAWDRTRDRSEERVFGEQRILGDDNPIVQSALASKAALKASFLWSIAKEACKGSAKVEHMCKSINATIAQTTHVVHPDRDRAANNETFAYRSKYFCVSSLRLARALLWCYMAQIYGENHVAMVDNDQTRAAELDRWQQIYDPVTKTKADDVYIMVAGLGLINNSLTIIQGHVLEGLEPATRTHDAIQAPHRFLRFGQTHPVVTANWLTTAGTAPERSIDERIRDSNLLKAQLEETLQAEDASEGQMGSG